MTARSDKKLWVLMLAGLGLAASACTPIAPEETCDGEYIPPVESEGPVEECNELDDDGDGVIDEGYFDLDGDGQGDCEAPPEECNDDGVDEDMDGNVDEGFPDLDGDNIADCTDDDCVVVQALAADAALNADCSGGVIDVPNLWNVTEEWAWEGADLQGFSLYERVHSAPVVGTHMVDIDGDGAPDDQPMVVAKGVLGQVGEDAADAAVFFIDGATGLADPSLGDITSNPFYFFPDLDDYSGMAIANIDADSAGWNEVVTITGLSTVVAITGQVPANPTTEPTFWESTDEISARSTVPTVADLDGDGAVEVLAHNLILQGASGALIQDLPLNTALRQTIPAVADTDGDGYAELYIGDQVWAFNTGTGQYELSWSMPYTGTLGHYTVIIDADEDGDPEVLSVADGRIYLFEPDGTLITSRNQYSEAGVGPPCVADFDGDGLPEVAMSAGGYLNAHDLTADMPPIWSPVPVSDDATTDGYRSACSGFDFDNDGSFELLYTGEDDASIYDGATGAVLWTMGNPAQVSDTAYEYATVADIDQDGSAEVLVVSFDPSGSFDVDPDSNGVRAFGHVDGSWAAGQTTWPLHDFADSNISEYGDVPGPEVHPWEQANVLRAMPGTEGLPDLRPEIVDLCVSSCIADVGRVFVEVQVHNEGNAAVDAGYPVDLYALDSGGALVGPLASTTGPAIPQERSADSFTLEFAYQAYVDAQGVDLVVVVDELDAVEECDVTDNSDDWGDGLCL